MFMHDYLAFVRHVHHYAKDYRIKVAVELRPLRCDSGINYGLCAFSGLTQTKENHIIGSNFFYR